MNHCGNYVLWSFLFMMMLRWWHCAERKLQDLHFLMPNFFIVFDHIALAKGFFFFTCMAYLVVILPHVIKYDLMIEKKREREKLKILTRFTILVAMSPLKRTLRAKFFSVRVCVCVSMLKVKVTIFCRQIRGVVRNDERENISYCSSRKFHFQHRSCFRFDALIVYMYVKTKACVLHRYRASPTAVYSRCEGKWWH